MRRASRRGPALATETIESFESSVSTTQAGGHPDIHTSFTLADPGSPEAARNVTFNAPEGVFGNPQRDHRVHPSDFALQQCPSDSQAGLITVRANYEGDPNYLLGTAPLFVVDPGEDQTALLAFIVPILQIPINIPVTVRTADDYGLRFTVSNITQLTPLAAADLTFWGYPGGRRTRCPALRRRAHRALRRAARHEAGTSCIARPLIAGISVHPFTDNPTSAPGSRCR